MSVTAFAADATRSIAADWLELELLSRGTQRLGAGHLTRSQSVLAEPEHGTEIGSDGSPLDAEITDARDEKLRDDVWDELHYRWRVLGEAYPFRPVRANLAWRIEVLSDASAKRNPGRTAYLTCLAMTALRFGLLRPPSQPAADALVAQIAPVFQDLAYVVAPRVIGGKANSFGWPRAESTGFSAAISELVAQVGHGELKQPIPLWATGAEKDGTVDVVAWRPFSDGRYGSVMLYGQVASGRNWRTKPIRSYIDGYFFDWFVDTPSRHYIPAMFIPFPLHGDVTTPKGGSFDAVALATARRDERNYGTILDRLRIAELLAAPRHECAEFEAAAWRRVVRWTASALLLLRRT